MVHLLLFLLDNALVISGRFVKVNPFAKRRFLGRTFLFNDVLNTLLWCQTYGKGSLRQRERKPTAAI